VVEVRPTRGRATRDSPPQILKSGTQLEVGARMWQNVHGVGLDLSWINDPDASRNASLESHEWGGAGEAGMGDAGGGVGRSGRGGDGDCGPDKISNNKRRSRLVKIGAGVIVRRRRILPRLCHQAVVAAVWDHGIGGGCCRHGRGHWIGGGGV
jgi:hypothetical protein